jgi:zinc protease
VQLTDAKRLWIQAWRPDRASIVVVGDVTKDELDAQLASAFGAWHAAKTPPLPIVTPPPPTGSEDAKIRVVLVDRPEASQAVVQVVRPGIAAADPRFPPLSRANIALGGSFTSRLNRDLREAHGWTYGAASWVTAPRSIGAVAAGGTFVLDKTVEALKALLRSMDDFARAGMTEEEARKTRMQARTEIVEEYETVDRASLALARNAGLGLEADYESKASVLADGATDSELKGLVAEFFSRRGATVVVVGPRAKLEAPLMEAGFGPLEYRDAEGAPARQDAKK